MVGVLGPPPPLCLRAPQGPRVPPGCSLWRTPCWQGSAGWSTGVPAETQRCSPGRGPASPTPGHGGHAVTGGGSGPSRLLAPSGRRCCACPVHLVRRLPAVGVRLHLDHFCGILRSTWVRVGVVHAHTWSETRRGQVGCRERTPPLTCGPQDLRAPPWAAPPRPALRLGAPRPPPHGQRSRQARWLFANVPFVDVPVEGKGGLGLPLGRHSFYKSPEPQGCFRPTPGL